MTFCKPALVLGLMSLAYSCAKTSTSKGTSGDASTMAGNWVGTWAAGPQLTEPGNLPPTPGLAGNTLRQVVLLSLGGSHLRVQLSNAYGTGPLTIRRTRVATAGAGSAAEPASDASLTFGSADSVTIPPGETVFSDALERAVSPLGKLAITLFFDGVPPEVTGHPGSRTTSYIATGDATSTEPFPAVASTDHWYFISAVDVAAPSRAAAIVTLGDSITDGRGSTTNGNDRWPDNLSRRLRENRSTAGVSVLNLGIGGNAVLAGGLGPTAVARFERDVLGQHGVRWLIVLEGVNDIGGSTDPAVAARLIAAYQQFIDAAHERNIRAYGVPILPFGGSMYFTEAHEAARQNVNEWMRSSRTFDAVIDLDAAVRDPANPVNLLPAYDSGDHLHLSVAGYKAMADAIDLTLFAD